MLWGEGAVLTAGQPVGSQPHRPEAGCHRSPRQPGEVAEGGDTEPAKDGRQVLVTQGVDIQ